MFGARRALCLVVLLPLLSFCGKRETLPAPAAPPTSTASSDSAAPAASVPAATAAPPAAAAAIATADGETPGVTVAIKELKRASGGIVSLKFVITNGSDKRIGTGYEFGDPDNHIRDFASVGGVQLIDPVGKKKYFVARDTEGKCICSQGLKDIAKGASLNAWAKFPAPPDDVQKISVIIPHFSPLDDVPISR